MDFQTINRSPGFLLHGRALRRVVACALLGPGLCLYQHATGTVASATEPTTSVETPPKERAPDDRAPGELETGESGSKLSDAQSAQALASVRYLASIGLRHVPKKFDGKKHWGDTKKVWAGVEVDFEDGKLKTHRRYRDAEHGRWMQYEVNLPENGLALDKSVWINQVTKSQVADRPQDLHSDEGFRIDATVITPATYEVRIQRWNYGVRMSSVTVKGRLNLRLDTLADIRMGPDYSEVPPAIQISPQILSAKISIDQFEVERVSHIGGDTAELWGDIVQELFMERLIDAQNEKLVEKLNRSIDKNREDLRISMADAIQKGLGRKP
jgi:hypothetical protein